MMMWILGMFDIS